MGWRIACSDSTTPRAPSSVIVPRYELLCSKSQTGRIPSTVVDCDGKDRAEETAIPKVTRVDALRTRSMSSAPILTRRRRRYIIRRVLGVGGGLVPSLDFKSNGRL